MGGGGVGGEEGRGTEIGMEKKINKFMGKKKHRNSFLKSSA